MSKNQVVSIAPRTRLSLLKNKIAVVAVASAPLSAFAVETAIDTTSVVSTLGLAVAAVGALGAAKLAPAALTWVWSLVTGMAKRG